MVEEMTDQIVLRRCRHHIEGAMQQIPAAKMNPFPSAHQVDHIEQHRQKITDHRMAGDSRGQNPQTDKKDRIRTGSRRMVNRDLTFQYGQHQGEAANDAAIAAMAVRNNQNKAYLK